MRRLFAALLLLTSTTALADVVIRSGTKGSSAQAPVTSTANGANHQGLDVVLQNVGGNPCENPAATLVSLSGSTSGTAAVELVPLSGTTKIYLCSLTVIGVSGTTPTFSLVGGTGSACGTGQSVVVSAWSTAAGTIYPFAFPVAVGKAGDALCYLDTGTTPVQRYTLTYVQQ